MHLCCTSAAARWARLKLTRRPSCPTCVHPLTCSTLSLGLSAGHVPPRTGPRRLPHRPRLPGAARGRAAGPAGLTEGWRQQAEREAPDRSGGLACMPSSPPAMQGALRRHALSIPPPMGASCFSALNNPRPMPTRSACSRLHASSFSLPGSSWRPWAAPLLSRCCPHSVSTQIPLEDAQAWLPWPGFPVEKLPARFAQPTAGRPAAPPTPTARSHMYLL